MKKIYLPMTLTILTIILFLLINLTSFPTFFFYATLIVSFIGLIVSIMSLIRTKHLLNILFTIVCLMLFMLSVGEFLLV
ncbi:hypothetical protein [Mammaliicoccus stepanovicii]|uniref:Uncharacterized protein n=1 Tax=Mammaliicoccus stepanovicii TaxID=643214 RepID=A0A239ZGL2_9STAP|nr:hypothetical protein [Mammaliicoccus stepanovicii]PNZ71779.1 hypothetical protein CD111_12145 [Mammaliicoccus stepanovicii]GGI41938.1 hypothetical protein GCM10010896_15920 [Mammaliicoccus stepanovicii]SNV69686.1 Uncharacterised protein [Mammaliicoccus stepanovicii]